MTVGAPHLIVTSINPPNAILGALADGAVASRWRFIIVGDTKSPADFELAGADFLDIDAQLATDLKFARACPTRHYARKNIGYLLAIRAGAPFIVETDDDNRPLPSFFGPRQRQQTVPASQGAGWLNVYRYYTDQHTWPRGLPLEAIRQAQAPYEELRPAAVDCPIQQGLADLNPDVDAIYRLILPLPLSFRQDRRLALGPGSWCPFNSQNTSWWPEAYPLLYLPAYCSFRMTDIWRSFIAQRIAWENDWHILFHEPTVEQDRNEHALLKDFSDEVPGYLHNARNRHNPFRLGSVSRTRQNIRQLADLL